MRRRTGGATDRAALEPRRPLRTSNLFDALRLLAALAVLVSHSFALAGAAQPTIGGSQLGILGVDVFFGISGYLIAQSWCMDPSLGRFALKRVLRIVPALVVMLLLVTLVLGPAVTTLSLAGYFGDATTWQYLLSNVVFITAHELPGVFLATPTPLEVNASIHTLSVEVMAYIAVAVAGVAGMLTRRWFAPVVLLVLVALPHQSALPWPGHIFWLQAFAAGTCLYLFRERVPWHWAIAAAAVAGWLIAPASVQDDLIVLIAPYVAIVFAQHGPSALRVLAARGDFSYGIYIYAWPVGQTLVYLWGPSITTAQVIAISLPITYLLAALSWVLIERPALSLKKRLSRRSVEPRAATAAPAPALERALPQEVVDPPRVAGRFPRSPAEDARGAVTP